MSSKQYETPVIEQNTIEELSKQLIKANGELKRLQEEREMMFANISHDLRAPMTAIRSAVDLALSSKDATKEEYRETIELIDRRSKTLESLVNDMYFLYSIANVPSAIDFEEIDAVPFLEEYFYDLSLDSRYDGYELLLDIDEGCGGRLNIDVQKIVRVLDNLFTNAARYSPKGTSISLKARNKGNSIEIMVSDSGPGISEQDLPYVFMRTYTASYARTPEGKSSGSGLGLSIAKAIVERHGGTISCRSIEGKGTDFIILLPFI